MADTVYDRTLAQRRSDLQIAEAPFRLEDEKFLRGAGTYIADVLLPGEVHCVFVRSTHGHARIRAIHTKTAAAATGVLLVLVGADIMAAELGGIPWEVRPPGKRYQNIPMGSPEGAMPQPLIAHDRARYVGEIVALVVAETHWQAQDACDLVRVEYEPLPVVGEVQDSLSAQTRIWPEFPDNVAFMIDKGDAVAVAKTLANAAVCVSFECRNNRVAGVPIEPRGYVGVYDTETQKYLLHACAAKPHPIRNTIALQVFHVAKEKVDVKVPDIGGGYGTKNVLYPEECLVLWAARLVGRPVKWISSREEAFLSDMAGRDQFDQGEMAFDKQGRILGFRARCISNLGAYLAPRGVVPVRNSGNVMSSVYRIPELHFEALGVFTNTAPTCSLRGSGQPEMSFLIESLLDRGARALGLDPIELRRRNILSASDFPYRTPFGLTYDTGDPMQVMGAALESAALDAFPERRKISEARGKRRGLGIANCIEALVVFYEEKAWLRLLADGRFECLLGTQSSGQGHATAYAQIVAGKLGVPVSAVTIVQGDTARVADGNGTGASRSISSGGSALALAVDDLIARGRGFLCQLLDKSEDKISFRDGAWEIAHMNLHFTPKDMAESADKAGRLDELQAVGVFSPQDGTFPYGCHVCEVEVDPETGAIEIQNYCSTHDVGFAINPALIDGQVHGSTVQGLGQALLEHAIYDPAGQLLTASLMDYGIPRASQVPSMNSAFVEIPSLNNPLGAKGVGESGTLGAPPALINAILDALWPLGVEQIDMPATPSRVWAAIQLAKRKSAGPTS